MLCWASSPLCLGADPGCHSSQQWGGEGRRNLHLPSLHGVPRARARAGLCREGLEGFAAPRRSRGAAPAPLCAGCGWNVECGTRSARNRQDKGFADGGGGQLVPIRPISQLSVSAGGRELKSYSNGSLRRVKATSVKWQAWVPPRWWHLHPGEDEAQLAHSGSKTR